MAIYAPRPDFQDKLDRTGLNRRKIAEGSGMSYDTLASYVARRVRASGAQANKLAKWYAAQVGIGDLDTARAELFEYVAAKKHSVGDRPRDESGRLIKVAS